MKQNSLDSSVMTPADSLCFIFNRLHLDLLPQFYQIICGSWQVWPDHGTERVAHMPPSAFLVQLLNSCHFLEALLRIFSKPPAHTFSLLPLSQTHTLSSVLLISLLWYLSQGALDKEYSPLELLWPGEGLAQRRPLPARNYQPFSDRAREAPRLRKR